jgi:hypothetical protein
MYWFLLIFLENKAAKRKCPRVGKENNWGDHCHKADEPVSVCYTSYICFIFYFIWVFLGFDFYCKYWSIGVICYFFANRRYYFYFFLLFLQPIYCFLRSYRKWMSIMESPKESIEVNPLDSGTSLTCILASSCPQM